MEFPEYRQFQNTQANSGLLRFRSAPSSLLSDFIDGGVRMKNANSSVGAQGSVSRYNFSCGDGSSLVSQGFQDLEDEKPVVSNGFALNSQLPPQYPRQSRLFSSMAMDHQGQQTKMSSNLFRQNSSPAGFLSHINVQNGHAMREVGNYRLGNRGSGDLSRLKEQISFFDVSSPMGTLSRISEVENEDENMASIGSDETNLGNGDVRSQFYSPGYSFGAWNGSSYFVENLNESKKYISEEGKPLTGSQNEEFGNRTSFLSHHLSLPKTSAEMAAVEKLLKFEDAVPCKIRAKRGCATHPRSIAERVRRTRISERMRKLQQLVPNMDKQTNTADMLDLAVEYIKELQKQYKTLCDIRARCKCSIQKSINN